MPRDTIPNLPPVPNMLPPFPAEAPLDQPLVSLVGLWLSISCQCGGSTNYPLRLLAARHGWQTPLRNVLPRLKCQRCRGRPAAVDLIDNPAAGPGTYGRTTKKVSLMP